MLETIQKVLKRIQAATPQPTPVCDCKLPGLSANDPADCPTCGKAHRGEVTA